MSRPNKEDEEVLKYQFIRESGNLMSSGSRKILQNRYKEAVVKNNPNKAIKISKLFDTPVHERLFIDNQKRKKRIEEMSQEEEKMISVSHSKGTLDVSSKMSFTKSGLNSYRSAQDLNPENPKTIERISASLKKALEIQKSNESLRKIANRSKREKMGS